MVNASNHLEKLFIKTNKYLYPPLEGQILVKSVFPEFSGVLVSHSDPSGHTLCGIYLDKNLAFWTMLCSLCITYLGLSNTESFVDSRWVSWWSSVPRVLPVVSGVMIFPSGVLHEPVGLSCPFFFVYILCFLLVIAGACSNQSQLGLLDWVWWKKLRQKTQDRIRSSAWSCQNSQRAQSLFQNLLFYRLRAEGRTKSSPVS